MCWPELTWWPDNVHSLSQAPLISVEPPQPAPAVQPHGGGQQDLLLDDGGGRGPGVQGFLSMLIITAGISYNTVWNLVILSVLIFIQIVQVMVFEIAKSIEDDWNSGEKVSWQKNDLQVAVMTQWQWESTEEIFSKIYNGSSGPFLSSRKRIRLTKQLGGKRSGERNCVNEMWSEVENVSWETSDVTIGNTENSQTRAHRVDIW